jgi:DNA repair protein RadC
MAAVSDYIPIAVAILGGGGLMGSVYALLKLRPEAGQMAVTTAQGVLVMQTQTIDRLEKENTQLRQRLELLEAMVDELRRKERERARRENGDPHD